MIRVFLDKNILFHYMRKIPFEDLYQYHCAKNEKLQLVTHNTKDFEQTAGVVISTPKEFLEQLRNQKVLSEKDLIYP